MPKRCLNPPSPVDADRRKRQALKYLSTPIGALLAEPGTTLHRWSNTTPKNVWFEDAEGAMVAHSDGYGCPVRASLSELSSFLEAVPHAESGHDVWRVAPALLAQRQAEVLETTPPAVRRTPKARL